MQFQGNVTINAPQSKVWEFFIDPNQVASCAPGVEKMEIIEENKKFKVSAAVGFGNIKAKFNNDVEFLELVPPSMAKIKVHGTAPGSAVDVIATMNISAEDETTTMLNWEADINVLGTIAALASRMMGSVTQKMAGQFFECAKNKIEE
jgi:carbon monoxide dehydrogenase subunit G